MKLKITFKDPDGVRECVRDEVMESIPSGLTDTEAGDLLETRTEAAHAALKPWIEWKEYITIEFDTEAGTARVLKA